MNFLSEFVAKNSPKFIVSQLIGFIASALLLFSFQQRTHKKIVAMQAFSGFLFALQYYMLGAYEGMAGNIVGMTRAIAYYFRGRSKIIDSFFCPILFALLAAGAGIATYSSPVSLLPMSAMIISSFVLWNPKAQQLRALTLPTSAMWLIYNIICSSVSGVVTEIFCEASIIIGLIRFRSKKSKSM